MRKQENNSFKAFAHVIILFALLVLISCRSNQNTADVVLPDSQKQPGKPKIDIHTAVLTDNLEALKQHIAAGSNLNEKDPFVGSSPLITACLFDKPEMAKTLLDAGADINFRNNDGSTALHTAAFFCRPALVQLLLDKGADKTIENKYGSTAYKSVAGPFSEMKNTYNMMGKMLAPMGLKLDYHYIEQTRPDIAARLK